MSFFKPPVDDPQAIFKYGKTWGRDEREEEILALAKDELENCECEEALRHLIERIRQ